MHSNRKRKIIVITPIKNEDWVLTEFLRQCSKWADYIILGMQGRSHLKLNKQKKVVVIDNEISGTFNEYMMRVNLINAARNIDKGCIMVALDADEILIPRHSFKEFKNVVNEYKPGTTIGAKWANIKPDLNHYWESNLYIKKIFIDNGSKYEADKIHTNNLPYNNILINTDIFMVAHLQYIDWNRMTSKQRWYQCWEAINNSEKSVIDIFRQYHHMYCVGNRYVHAIPQNWKNKYEISENRLQNLVKKSKVQGYWWDEEVEKYLAKYGEHKFYNIDIWSEKSNYRNINKIPFKSRLLLKYLKITQPFTDRIIIKMADSLLIKLGI